MMVSLCVIVIFCPYKSNIYKISVCAILAARIFMCWVLMHFLSELMPVNVFSVIKDQTLYIQDYIGIKNMRIFT